MEKDMEKDQGKEQQKKAAEKKDSNPYRQSQMKQKKLPGNQSLAQTSGQTPVVQRDLDQDLPKRLDQGYGIEQPAPKPVPVSQVLHERYVESRSWFKEEPTKTSKFYALLRPDLRELMEKDRKEKKIKSPNDLINFLIEEYYFGK